MDPIPDGDQVECSVPHCKRALCRGCTQEQQGSPECGPHARRHAAIDGLRAELLRARSYDTKLIQHREIESMMTIFMMGSEDWNRCRVCDIIREGCEELFDDRAFRYELVCEECRHECMHCHKFYHPNSDRLHIVCEERCKTLAKRRKLEERNREPDTSTSQVSTPDSPCEHMSDHVPSPKTTEQ
jgi:hypothetical protein